MPIRVKIFIIVLIHLQSFASYGNTPILERRVTLSYKNESVHNILIDISNQADFMFSYSPDDIPAERIICVEYHNSTVRHILNTMFEGTVDYRVRGRYLILKNADPAKADAQNLIVEGYLYDSATGEVLPRASVYNKKQMVAAVTDDYGYFKIEIPQKTEDIQLLAIKRGYDKEVIKPIDLQKSYIKLELQPLENDKSQDSLLLSQQSSSLKNFTQNIIPGRIYENAQNINDVFFSNVQFSVLPGISTNRLFAGNTVNKYSLNLTVGYTQGVEVLEFGSIGNIVVEDAGIVQAAGIFNVVGGNMKGTQLAGIYNYARTVDGIQGAGIINIADSIKGIQGAGIANITNYAGATQLASIFNKSNNITGVQAAGIFNEADSITGVQVAGIFNNASYVKGAQIGMINFADTIDGFPIGYFNFIKKGYTKFEVSADELYKINLAYRGGVEKFHTVFVAGVNPFDENHLHWTYGFGVGTSFNFKEKTSFCIDIMEQRTGSNKHFSQRNRLYRLGTGIDWHLASKFSIYLGITYNAYFVDKNSKGYDEYFSSFMPYYWSNDNITNDINIKTWPGAKASLRFF